MFLDQQLSCPNLAIPEYVMRHIVDVESGDNPFAIGVVGGRLERQPKTLEEAVATANMLESKGYNFSLGIAQINRYNLARFSLSPYEKAFDPCANLQAGSKILADCYASANGEWDKAFSCYYSGNFTTGFVTGYVQKIYNSMSKENTTATAAYSASNAIPLDASGQTAQNIPRQAKHATTDASRLSMRTIPFGVPAQTAAPALPATSALVSGQPLTAPATTSDTFFAQVRQTAGGNAQPSLGQVAQLVPPPGVPKVPDFPEVDEAFVF
jgi:type IV secretion system protein VirB1